MTNKKHKGKWKDINISDLKRRKIYSRLRSKAKEKLIKKHKKEYKKIFNGLLSKEYKNLTSEKFK